MRNKIAFLFFAAAGAMFGQAPATTTVADQLYMAIGGATCTGTITLSWSDFYSLDGFLIKAGSRSTTVNATGQFSVNVVPTNTNTTPASGIYSIQYNLQPAGCAATSEAWNVPAGGGPVNLNNVRTLPTPPPSLIPITSLAPPIIGGTYQLCYSAGLIQWSVCGLTSGITGAGTSGKLAKFTGPTAIGNASVTDIIGNFTGCSSVQYLGADGACHTTISALTSAAIIGLWSGCTGTQYLGADGNCHSGGIGTVTSAALTLPSWLTVAGSPITSSGTFAVSPTTAQTSHQVIGTCGSATTFTPCSLTGADLPLPTLSTFGVVEAINAGSHQWLASLANTGIFTQTQPGFGDLSGSAMCAQEPALTGDTTSSAGSCATTTSKINGTAFPASANGIASNGSSQPVAQTQNMASAIGYVAGGGTANAQTATYSPTFASCSNGLTVSWLPTAANSSTTPTLNVNSSACSGTIVKAGGAALAANDLTTTAIASAKWDGTNFELQNPQTAAAASASFFQPLTAPVSANFTDLNFNVGSGVVTTQVNGTTPVNYITLRQQDPSHTGNLVGIYKSTINATYTLTVALTITAGTPGGGIVGLMLYDGSAKTILFGTYFGGPTTPFIETTTSLTNSGSGASTVFTSSANYPQWGPLLWLRVQETASNRIYSTSSDGVTFYQVFSESVSAHFTTADYGMGLFYFSGAGDAGETMYSFSESHP